MTSRGSHNHRRDRRDQSPPLFNQMKMMEMPHFRPPFLGLYALITLYKAFQHGIVM